MPEPTPIMITPGDDNSDATVVALSGGGYAVSWRNATTAVVQYYSDDGLMQKQTSFGAAPYDGTMAHIKITALDNGGFAVTLIESDGIAVQAFDSTGTAVGAKTLLPLTFGLAPDITGLKGGGFVVTAVETNAYPNSDIHAQMFTDAGVASGATFNVNADPIFLARTTDTSSFYVPHVFAAPDGGFTVSWSAATDYDSSVYDTYLQSFNATGHREADHDRLINTGTDAAILDVTYLTGGDYIVTSNNIDGTNGPINSMPVLQRFHADGTPVGAPMTPAQQFEGSSVNFGGPVVALPDGGYILVWQDNQGLDGGNGFSDSIVAERFDASGNLVGAPALIGLGDGDQYFPHLAVLDDGKVVLTYLQSGDAPHALYEKTFTSVDDMFAYPHQFYLNDIVANRNDLLDGSTYSFIMAGHKGDDTYIVDSSDDQVIELNNEGTDTVMSSITFVTHGGQYIENITLTGTADINATGNGQNNILIGNSGNNVLNGSQGADTMYGGGGNDTYYVDNAGDVASEHMTGNADDGGNDVVMAAVTYTIGDYIESLYLTGYNAINGTGNAWDNTIIGNGAANRLDGGAGSDTVRGGAGNDILTGGDGHDAFQFEAAGMANGLDHVTDFTPGEDHLFFLGAAYGIASGATLSASQFSNTGNRTGPGGQFIYNPVNHTLYWDADGTGPQGAVSIAVFDNGVTLHASDFVFT